MIHLKLINIDKTFTLTYLMLSLTTIFWYYKYTQAKLSVNKTFPFKTVSLISNKMNEIFNLGTEIQVSFR